MGLLERDDELAALDTHWDRARGGQGGLAFVKGEAGAGKSTLLQAFVERCPDVTVLWGACDPLTTPRPLGPIHDLADRLGGGVPARLLDAHEPHEIFGAVFERLQAEPSILVIDDLHWADQGTVDLLRYVLRRIRTTRSLVVGAARDDESVGPGPLRALLGDLARSADALTMDLPPFSTDAIAVLLGDRAGDAARLRSITGGNPFFVLEMLDHDGTALPGTVRDAILARTTALGPDAWDLLHLLACAPEAIPDHLLGRLGVGLVPLRAVDRAGLIRRDGRRVALRHDLCRTAIGSTIPPGADASLHQRMLDALLGAGHADPAVVVHHAVGAGDRERAAAHALAAGRAAARSGAHTQAAEFFQVALAQGVTTTPSGEAELLELLAAEHYLVDRLGDAIEASERAMQLRRAADDTTGVSVNHHALSVYHWYNADRADAEHHAAEAVAVLDEADGRSDTELEQLGHGLAMTAYLAMQANDLEHARALLARAAGLATRVRSHELSVRLRIIGNIADVLAGVDHSRDATLAILRSAAAHMDETYSSGYSNLSYLDVEQRRFDLAAELLALSLPITVERDLPICRVWQTGSRGRLHLLEGRWAEAVADADAVLSAPSAPLARTWPHLARGLVALRSGGDADADLDEAWRLACRFGEPIRLLPAVAALAERAWLLGTEDERLADAVALLDRYPPVGLEWARGELAVWLRRLDPGAGSRPVIVGVAEPFQAELDGDPWTAAARWEAIGAPYERALALIATGRDDHRRDGLDILDRLGAERVAAKVRRDLRERGVATVPAPRRASTQANAAGLTRRQLDVLRLMGEGLTNAELAERLYISAKTVDHHVSAILTRLQVTGRRDAVRQARRLGVLD